MLRYLLVRLGVVIPMLLVVCAIAFGLLHLIPGDPAVGLLGEYATHERIAQVTEEYGLDKPVHEQFVTFVGRAARGELGTSPRSGLPVTTVVLETARVTIEVVVASLMIAVVVGLVTGAIAGLRAGSLVDRLVTGIATLAHAVPNFWFALMLLVVFGIWLGWFPILGFTSVLESPTRGLHTLALPAAALGLASATEIARQFRVAIVGAARSLFVRTARAGGLSRQRVFTRYVVPAALPPVLTTIGVVAVRLFGQTVLIETIFGIPGIGRVLVSAMQTSDIPVILGVVLMFGVLVIATNLAVDVLQLVVNPRLRLGGRTA